LKTLLLAVLAVSARAGEPVFDPRALLKSARDAAFSVEAPSAAERPAPRLSVGRDADGNLALTGADCAALEKQGAALAEWKARLREAPAAREACRCGPQGCTLRVDAPSFVRRVHDTRARRWGPNCWNTALVSAGILSAPGFASPEEMSFWMASPLCRPLHAAEAPRPGDIAAIRDEKGAEVHGFVYVSDELAFSKNYLTAASPYALQSPADVFGEYPVPALCRTSGGSAGCPAYIDLFRCSTREEYVRGSGLALEEDYLRAEKTVAEQEKAVAELVFGWQSGPEFRGRADGLLRSSAQTLTSLRERTRGRSGLLWNALGLRIDSLLHQLTLI
jgi:hypothetical protein